MAKRRIKAALFYIFFQPEIKGFFRRGLFEA